MMTATKSKIEVFDDDNLDGDGVTWFAVIGRNGRKGYRKIELSADNEEDAREEAEERLGGK